MEGGGSAEWRYSGDGAVEEEWLYRLLRERARDVVEQVKDTVARSQQLAWLHGAWAGRRLARRCAWCGRYGVGETWLDPGQTPPIPTSRTTHSICDDCTQALRDAGLSV